MDNQDTPKENAPEESTVAQPETNAEAVEQSEQPAEVEQEPVAEQSEPTTTLTRPTQRPLTDKDKFEAGEMLYALLENPEDALAFQEALERLDLPGNDVIRKWVRGIQEGDQILYSGNVFRESLHRDQSDWQQSVEHDGAQLVAGRPRFSATGGNKLEGERAVLKVQAMLGGGEPIQIPLWHSGIWISLKTPKNARVATTSDLIATEKANFGRMTNGLAFSNSSVFIVKHLVDLIIDHVYDCSVKDWTPELLRSLIRAADIPLLTMGILNTQYPSGYPYSRPCIATPKSCQHTEEALLNLSKLTWVDRNGLTKGQKDHMSKRRDRFTVEQILNYQKVFDEREARNVHDTGVGVKVVFKSPSLDEYIANGYEWIESILRMTDDAFDRPLARDERERHINEHATLETCRQYAHWVSHTIVTEEDDSGEVIETVIDDAETLEKLMDSFSQHNDSADPFLDAVRNYIDDSAVAVVGIPRYDCPKCQGRQEGDPKHPEIIPIDPVQTFFTLANQKLSLALSRGN